MFYINDRLCRIVSFCADDNLRFPLTDFASRTTPTSDLVQMMLGSEPFSKFLTSFSHAFLNLKLSIYLAESFFRSIAPLW